MSSCLYNCGYKAEYSYDLYLHYKNGCTGDFLHGIDRSKVAEYILFDDNAYLHITKYHKYPVNDKDIDIIENNEKISHIRWSDGQVYLYPYINDAIAWFKCFTDKKVVDFIKKNSYWNITDGYVPKSVACFIVNNSSGIEDAYQKYCDLAKKEFVSDYTCPFVSFLDTILIGEEKQKLYDYNTKYMNTSVLLEAVNRHRNTPKVLDKFYKSSYYREAIEIIELENEELIKNNILIHPAIAIKFMKWSHINFRKVKNPDIDQYEIFTHNIYCS